MHVLARKKFLKVISYDLKLGWVVQKPWVSWPKIWVSWPNNLGELVTTWVSWCLGELVFGWVVRHPKKTGLNPPFGKDFCSDEYFYFTWCFWNGVSFILNWFVFRARHLICYLLKAWHNVFVFTFFKLKTISAKGSVCFEHKFLTV